MAIALYARKSIERENSISCETQIEYCRTMLRPEEKNEKIITFVDNGSSGGNIDRDGFREMMKQIENGQITKVICYRLDRISRSLSDFVGILDTLKKHGVSFISSQEAFDTSTSYGELIVKILMVFAEFERQSIIERVTQAYAHRSALGLYMGGRRPYGFALTETEIRGIKTKKFCPMEEEIEQIRNIFETYSTEGVSLRFLANQLNKNNILPKDGRWSPAKLSSIIKNPIYVKADNAVYEYYSSRKYRILSDISAFDGIHGLQLYGKTKHHNDDMSAMKLVVLPHEGVIPSDLWLSCQKKIVKNKQTGNSLSNTTTWLGGKVICKTCGRTMRVVKGNLRKDGSYTRYFGCRGKTEEPICSGIKVPVYAESLEDMTVSLIAQKLTTLRDIRLPVRKNNSNRLNQMKNRISEIKSTRDKIAELVLNESVEPDMLRLLNEKAKQLSDEFQKILENIAKIENSSSEITSPRVLSGKWENASFEERKVVCGLLIDNIYIDQDGTTEVVWNI